MGLIDAIGTQHVRVTQSPRIVSLVPSITELLCDLGLSENIVGRTGFCIHPRDSVRNIAKVGGTKDVDLKKLRALAPTHVVLNIDENLRETADELREIVPHLIVTHPLGPEDNIALYELLGGIFACEERCTELCRQLTTALSNAAATNFGEARKVLYLIWRQPWMTVSRDTYIARMLAIVNWHTIANSPSARYPELDLQQLTERPELVLLSSEPYPFREKHIDEIQAELGQHVPVRLIEGDQVSWYGSRAISGVNYLVDFAAQVSDSAPPD